MQNVVLIEQKIRNTAAVRQDAAAHRAARPAAQARRAGRSGVQAVRAARRAHAGGGHRRRDRRLRARSPASCDEEERDPIPRIDSRQQLRRHDGARRVRAHRATSTTAALELARRRLAAFARAGRPVGDQGRLADRLSAGRADERRQRGHAQHARRDPSARARRSWTLGIVRRMKRLTADRAEIGLQVIANDAARRRPDRAAQEHATTTTRSTASAITINGRAFGALFLALRKRDGETRRAVADRARRSSTSRLEALQAASRRKSRVARSASAA